VSGKDERGEGERGGKVIEGNLRDGKVIEGKGESKKESEKKCVRVNRKSGTQSLVNTCTNKVGTVGAREVPYSYVYL